MQQGINSFTTYILTPDEEVQAAMLPELTIVWLQNELAKTASQKLALKVEDGDTDKYFRNLYYLTGQIEILTYILALGSAHLLKQPKTPEIVPEF